MIVLTGMPGSGKSTVARSLGALVGQPVLDTDTLLHLRYGDLLGQDPSEARWAAFRVVERQLVLELAGAGRGLLALGGGAWIDTEVRDALLTRHWCVYLRCTVDTLVARGALRGRVMFRSGDPQTALHDLLRQRQDAYESAHLVLDVDRLPEAAVAERIRHTTPERSLTDGFH